MKRAFKAILKGHVLYFKGKRYFADYTNNPAIKYRYRVMFPGIPECTNSVSDMIINEINKRNEPH
ncbi:hypothetical protein [uncultured Mucilaginibacter sp.]|uniref:hypothetical protein n=1 Tax=uncultured Mucilaginibacter sp. TaxID=797541 RepID=UPI0025CE11D8|nr:hypothetical protein [uncultured Mucilaginibacter sp.]